MPVLTDVDEVLRRNDLSLRDEAIRAFLTQAKADEAEGYDVIIGGDFNEPSHLDWTAQTRYLYDHHGLVVPWTVSTLLAGAGFKDAYRVAHPNVLTHPGFTYPSDNPRVAVERLSWAPMADERERIDYVLYKGRDLQVKSAAILGYEGCIVRHRRRTDISSDTFIAPSGVYPSDHKGVLVRLSW